MVRKILMFYGNGCMDATFMMPGIRVFNMGEKYKFEIYEIWKDKEGQKILEKHKDLIKKETGKDGATPVFVDLEKKSAVWARSFEQLMEWLEGPDWWK